LIGYADNNCISTAVCIGGVCRCPTNWFYNVNTDTCDRAIPVGQDCTASYECMTNANCTSVAGVFICQCIAGTRYSIIYGECITPISYNQSCVLTADCASNFICTTVNGASYCLCGTDSRYYNSFNATCLDKVLYNQPCSSTGPYCDDVRLLQCTATSTCITNANCVANVCACISGSYYYDITTGQCIALKAYGVSCTEQQQCETGLDCISNICQCLTTQYYNATSTTCTAGATINAACNSASGLYCSTGAGLYCNSVTSTCLCPTNYYWNGTKCLQKNYLYNSCTASTQCPTNGVCTGGICQCTAATYYYNSTLNSCVVYSTYGQTCVANVFVSSECSSTQTLVCSSTTSGLCQCSSSDYYNAVAVTCSAKSNSGVACASSSTCNDLLGLSCTAGTCTCGTGTYWSGTTCVATLGAGQVCAAAAQCTSPLTCGSPCQCPATYYLDLVTVNCILKKAAGVACTYGFECTSGTCTSSLCT
jgi:hypothetical protein